MIKLKNVIVEKALVNEKNNFVSVLIKDFIKSVWGLNQISVKLETEVGYFINDLTRLKKLFKTNEYAELLADYKNIKKLSKQVDKELEKFYDKCGIFLKLED